VFKDKIMLILVRGHIGSDKQRILYCLVKEAIILKKVSFFQGIGANPLFAAKDRSP
jgi:hypothetical protein